MGKITIYLSLKDGVLQYRDSEKHHGKTIETSVDPGDKIIWTLDKDSGISDLSGINIIGSCKFLSRGPKKKACDKWVSKVSRKAEGRIEYNIFYTINNKTSFKEVAENKSVREDDPAQIVVRV